MDIDPPNNLPRTPGKGPLDGGSGHIAAGPSRHVDAIPEAHTDISGNGQTSGNRLYSVKLTSNMLPQIGQLARDVLRGADEKVGIASGCYNTVSPRRPNRTCIVLHDRSTDTFDRWMQLYRSNKRL
jgi:hypothetical protein